MTSDDIVDSDIGDRSLMDINECRVRPKKSIKKKPPRSHKQTFEALMRFAVELI